jgi:predicted dehydrogenase
MGGICMKPVFGIIGCGGISRLHLPGLIKAGAAIARVSDLEEQNARPFIETFGAKYSADWRAVAEDPKVTAVLVFTGSFLHKEISLAALKAGKDVVCEKTLTIDANDAYELASAAKASGRIFITAYMKRFFPATEAAKALIPSLGKLYAGQVRAFHQWGNLHDEAQIPAGRLAELQTVKQRNGSIVLMCAGSHMLDMMMHFLGRPASVYASMDYITGTDLERRATGLFEYPGGLAVHFEAAANSHTKVGIHGTGWDEYIKLTGTQGRLELYTVDWDKPEQTGMTLIHYDNAAGSFTERRFDPVSPFTLEVAAYCNALAQRTPIRPDGVDGFNVDAAIGAMFEADRTKAQVAIDWRGL